MSYYSDLDNRPDPARKRKLFYRYFSAIDGRVLDIGCSTGNFIQHAPSRIVGIDLDDDGLAVARSRGFRCTRADLGDGLPFAAGSFDAVNCDSIVEHLGAPLAFLREVHRVLAPGGTVIVITPNIYRVRHRFWRDYTHVHPFCAESLERLAYDAGFRNMTVRTYSLNYLKLLSRRSPGWKGGRQPVWWVLEDLIGNLAAGNLVMHARK